jgi:DNA-directed RNA polymerase specialized sigma24 family protein
VSRRDAEYTQYVEARLMSLRRLAVVLCGDRQRADDLVQTTLTNLYVHWGTVRAAEHADAYARAVLVREFIHERRSSWSRRVTLSSAALDRPAAAVDQDAVLDLRAAVAALALTTVRQALSPAGAPASGGRPAAADHQSYPEHHTYPGGPDHE